MGGDSLVWSLSCSVAMRMIARNSGHSSGWGRLKVGTARLPLWSAKCFCHFSDNFEEKSWPNGVEYCERKWESIGQRVVASQLYNFTCKNCAVRFKDGGGCTLKYKIRWTNTHTADNDILFRLPRADVINPLAPCFLSDAAPFLPFPSFKVELFLS